MTDAEERLSRTARGWDEAADGYQEYFVPRFAPWVKAAVEAVAEVPDGPILVPCCGTFPELDLLAPRFPGRAIVGIDLSAEMVRLARERARRLPASTSSRVMPRRSIDDGRAPARRSSRCSACSSYRPRRQLSVRGSARSGRAAGCASSTGRRSPRRPGRSPSSTKSSEDRADRSWEDGLVDALEGAVIERDELVAYPMSHPSAAAYFDAADRAGPLRSLALARGDAFIAELRKQYVDQAPAGEWTHHPHARLLAVRKATSAD